jgi:RNA-directed DNA polymerase
MNSIFYPSELLHWSSIQWKSNENTVSRIQHRIAKATLKDDQRQIRNLQRLLIKSLSARLKAVKQVSEENTDRRIPGIDGELWITSKSKLKAALSLRKKTKTKPLCRIYNSKVHNYERPLEIATMTDRAKQALWNFALNPVVDTLSNLISYEFRPYFSCWDAHLQIKAILSRKKQPKWVLNTGIQKCFKTINYESLLENIPIENKVFSSWLKSGILNDSSEFNHRFLEKAKSGFISQTLLTYVLNGLQQVLKETFTYYQIKGPKQIISYSSGITMILFENNFIVTGHSYRQLERIMTIISDYLKLKGLYLYPENTKIVNVHDGFHFLGWNFKKYKTGIVLCNISKQYIKDFKMKIRGIVKNSKNKTTSTLINELNSVIRIWFNNHCYATNILPVWNHINHYLYKLLWKWVRKRHPRKSHFWIYDHYWKIFDGRRTFLTLENNKKIRLISLSLKTIKDITIL